MEVVAHDADCAALREQHALQVGLGGPPEHQLLVDGAKLALGRQRPSELDEALGVVPACESERSTLRSYGLPSSSKAFHTL
eukprot:3816103-Alexandrium_andersonii.AAC.1